MTLQTARELIREASLMVAEVDVEMTTTRVSRLSCRWERDPRTGQLSCIWTLQPDEQ